MMLNQRIINICIIIFVAILSNTIYSQTNTEQKIHNYFRQLQVASSIAPCKSSFTYYPFYETYIYQDKVNERRNKSGAICKEYLISEKLTLLKKIHISYLNEDTTSLYSLVDDDQNVIFDIVKTNCRGGRMLNSIDTINQKVLIELIDSYNKWYDLIKANGIENVLKNKILPTSFSKYKWVKEYGYLSGEITNPEIIDKSLLMMNDSVYSNYFINRHGIKKRLENKTIQEVIKELTILVLLNNQTPFTFNIIDFKLIGTTDQINIVFDKLRNNKSTFIIVSELLKENNIDVVLSM